MEEVRMRRMLAVVAALLMALTACAGGLGSSDTVYTLLNNPDQYQGQQVTVLGYYLGKPGSPELSLLVPGVSTNDAGSDTQPLGEPIWLEGFPQALQADLHHAVDAVYGAVKVTGAFESGGRFGPDGTYQRRLSVVSAEVAEEIERFTETVPGAVPAGVTPLGELFKDPGRFAGQKVTTRGYYFWSPATSGLLAEGVSAEKLAEGVDPALAAAGSNPRPDGQYMAMDGFPPELSSQLHIGPANSFVWGLVELTGTFETGGNWGVGGTIPHHFQIEQVKPLAQP
jgi:hypothetical protein